MRVAALQFDVRRGEVSANLEVVCTGLREARERGVELLLLPELWPTSFVPAGEKGDWVGASEEALGRVVDLAAELDLAVAGSGYGAAPGDLPRNRFTLFDRGECLLRYDKVQLFSPTGEGLGFSPGTSPPPTARVRGLLVSGVVCYDVRFASLLRAPFLAGAELLLVPAQWPVGRASHWRALLRGRAVEHQAFVLGANRTGSETMGRRSALLEFPGNSLVADPAGHLLAEGDGAGGLVVADLDPRAPGVLRRDVPVRRDERLLEE